MSTLWPSWLPAALPTPLLALPPFPALSPASLTGFSAFAHGALDVALKNPRALKEVYARADPLHSAVAFAALNSALVWFLGEVTGNVSQVDREWSFLPVIYTLHFTLHPLLTSSAPLPTSLSALPSYLLTNLSPIQLLALATQLAWSARLTFNGWRRGFFNPRTEDYRWLILRDNWPKGVFGWLAWRVFNAAFIAVIQNILLLAIALPSYFLLLQSPVANREPLATYTRSELAAFQKPASPSPTLAHYVLAGLAFACVLGQYAADGQHQVFQAWKHTPAERREPTATWRLLGGLGGKLTFDRYDFVRGFISTGLWSYSRHPAFALEQTFWWLQALFPLVPLLPSLLASLPNASTALRTAFAQSVASRSVGPLATVGGQLVRDLPVQAVAGAMGLTALFLGSTALTEYITSRKYPLYRSAYQRRVGMFLPLETYAKRVYQSVVRGNAWRRAREAELGWFEKSKKTKTM